ncbi:MAG: hypothetical protein KJ600_04455 [Nanoarchaeota archaeon]|nr:hypothetical protein [Nanoarchaeota archaeon]MBU1103780.1 hypothetical protein [Nanoarchaeota archaeon]
MSELKKAAERVIYWKKKHDLFRKAAKGARENGDCEKAQTLDDRLVIMRVHVLASCDYLTRVYESETGKTVERVGTLESIPEISARLEAGGNIQYI